MTMAKAQFIVTDVAWKVGMLEGERSNRYVLMVFLLQYRL
jgi:hypothetical protein